MLARTQPNRPLCCSDGFCEAEEVAQLEERVHASTYKALGSQIT